MSCAPSFLQQNLAAATSGLSPNTMPHHPIICTGNITFDEDGTFACEHHHVGRADERLQACLNHSVACLLIEMAVRL